MIYITGDTHIPIDIRKLSTRSFPEQKELTKNDFVIICGDFGGIWSNNAEEKYWLKWLYEKSFTTLFVDGNHENFHMLYENYKVIDFNGGKARKINDSIYHLMRGQIFILDGFKIFTMGGALSHDKEHRVKDATWWEEELPSEKEYIEAKANLKANNNTVDYIITHCAPDSIQTGLDTYYKTTGLTEFFNTIKNNIKYKHWYFGHYHRDVKIDKKHTCLYNKIVKIGNMITTHIHT